MSSALTEILRKTKIIPVAVFNDVKSAARTAEILIEESLPLVEVTLRTPEAFRCIVELASNYEGMIVGAGSVLSREAVKKAVDAGAAFCVSPCMDRDICEYASQSGVPFIPGAATPSELNAALQMNFSLVKIFPAASLGGPGYISAVAAPYRMYSFKLIPTGGINEGNLADYVKNPQVIAVGASYLIDSSLVDSGGFEAVRDRIRRAREIVASV